MCKPEVKLNIPGGRNNTGSSEGYCKAIAKPKHRVAQTERQDFFVSCVFYVKGYESPLRQAFLQDKRSALVFVLHAC